MSVYISNAFALSMVSDGDFRVTTLSIDEAWTAMADGFESAIGHADVATIVSGLLGVTVQANRVNLSLVLGDTLVVAQYIGPRLAEGTTLLPEGSKIVFKKVEVL